MKELRIKFATHGFIEDDVYFVNDLLTKKFNEKFSIYKDNGKFYIKSYTDAARAVTHYMLDVFPKSMNRKLEFMEK